MPYLVKRHVPYKRESHRVELAIKQAIDRLIQRGDFHRRPSGEIEITTKGLLEASKWERFCASFTLHI